MEGRLLDLTLSDPYDNLAFEEALLRRVEVPTLRLWDNQRSVVIGRAQLAGYETDLEYCRENAVPVVRRVTAGGAVYNGPGNLNWSFAIPRGSWDSWLGAWTGANGVFRALARVVVRALERCQVESRYEEPNTIVTPDGKVCGMAAYMAKDTVLCHGTLLLGADLEAVRRLTRPRREPLPSKYPRSRFTEVANCAATRREVKESLAGSMMGFVEGEQTRAEASLAAELRQKYRSREWNLGDPFSLDYL